MNQLFLIVLVFVLFIYFGGKYVPSVLKKNKNLLLGVVGGLVLCSFLGMRIEGVRGPECNNIDERLSEVNTACCDGDKDCARGPPTECSKGCADVFLPFWSDCSEELGSEATDLFSNIVTMCQEEEQQAPERDCPTTLSKICGETKGNALDCAACGRTNLSELTAAGCDNQSISAWCASDAPPVIQFDLERRPCTSGMDTWMGLPEYLGCSCDDTRHKGKGAARSWKQGGNDPNAWAGYRQTFQCRALGDGIGNDNSVGDPDSDRNICKTDTAMVTKDDYDLDGNGFPCICPLGAPGNEEGWAARTIFLSEWPRGVTGLVEDRNERRWGITYTEARNASERGERATCCGCVGDGRGHG